MKKQQNIYLGILLVVLLLAWITASMLMKKSNDTDTTGNESQQTVEDKKPMSLGDKQKIITETFWENPDIEDIFALQDILGPEIVMEMDCNIITEEKAKVYCAQEKDFYIDFFNELTWWKVVSDGLENIDSVNCDDIVAEAGKQLCRDYKNNQ